MEMDNLHPTIKAAIVGHFARPHIEPNLGALHQILAFCDTRLREGTREYADMRHIHNIAREALGK